MFMPQTSDVLEWRGLNVVDNDGSKLGKIEEIYLDAETEQPEWALVHTGLFGGKSSFMPLQDANRDGDQVVAPYSKDQVKSAPQMDADGQLSQQEESALYSHYGLDYTEARSDSGLPEGGAGGTGVSTGGSTGGTTGGSTGDMGETGTVGHDTSGPNTDDAMTRSEEELRVGTTQRESGRARLRKYIVTEDVQKTVPVQREEVRIEREPITDANRDAATSGGDLTEEEHEVTLHEEQVTVDKNVVPKERVRLDKDVTTEQREVSESVRKEQIEAEGDTPR